MSDQFGALALPVPVPAARPDLPTNLTAEQASLTDPGLDTLLSFCAAVLNHQLNIAWAARSPAAQKNQVARIGFLSTNDPREGDFIDSKLPGLFLYRAQIDDAGLSEAESVGTTETLRLEWVFPQDTQHKERLRNNIVNGIFKTLVLACEQGRHPAWTVVGDDADTDAIRTAIVTSTSAQSYTGAALNGAIGAGSVHAARPVTITTASAVGAYNTADPIQITGTLFNGRAGFVEEISLTEPDGGETVSGIWNFSDVSEIAVPPQLLVTGSLTFGYAASPEKAYGSPVRRYADLTQLRCVGARKVTLSIDIKAGPDGAARKPLQYDVFQMDLRIQERFHADVAAANGVMGRVDGIGADMDYSYPDNSGDVFSSASF